MKLFFDLLIAAAIIITALPAVILLWHRKKTENCWEAKHKNLSLAVSLILILGSLMVLYGSFLEPRLLITNYQTIDLVGVAQPFKIAFIADFQVGKYRQTAWVEKVTARILELKPDLILIGGDQVDNESYNLQELDYLLPLQKLAKQTPTYAVHGNHEYGVSCFFGIEKKCHYTGDISRQTKKALEKIGVRYLVNNLEQITIQNQSFYLFGGDDYWTKNLDYAALEQRKGNIPTIALVHNPLAVLDASKYSINLLLAGHTHGGQIRLPFIGPLGLVDAVIPKNWYQGWHEYQGLKFFVTSGAGETGARSRLFNPPEIVLLTIK